MRAKITKRIVDAARPRERDTFIWDTETRGFGLKVTPAGKRIYIVQARHKGPPVRYTIGKHGAPWTPDSARDEATRALGQIAAGINPNRAKAEGNLDQTVAELCDLYLAEGCDKKKPATMKVERGLIKRHIKPLLGRKRLRSITRADVERFMADIAAGKTAADEKTGPRGRARVRGGQGTSNRTTALLSSMLTFAAERGLRPDNPAHGIKKYRQQDRDHFLSPKEMTVLGDILSRVEADNGNLYAVAAIRLLVLTGCRKNEILSLKWGWVDFERASLRLPDSKTGAKVVPLATPALSLLQALPRIEGNDHVFPSTRGDGHLVGLQKVWARIRDLANIPDVRLHDLRHSFASVGAASGDSLYVIGKLLGHSQSRTTQRYAHLSEDPVRHAAERIAGQIASAMSGKNGGEA
jgi:integrase